MKVIIAAAIAAFAFGARAADNEVKCPMFGRVIGPDIWEGYSSTQNQLSRKIKHGDKIPLNQFVNKAALAKYVEQTGTDQFLQISSAKFFNDPVANGTMIGICSGARDTCSDEGAFRAAVNAGNIDSMYLKVHSDAGALVGNTFLSSGGLALSFVSGDTSQCPEKNIVEKNIRYFLSVSEIYDAALK